MSRTEVGEDAVQGIAKMVERCVWKFREESSQSLTLFTFSTEPLSILASAQTLDGAHLDANEIAVVGLQMAFSVDGYPAEEDWKDLTLQPRLIGAVYAKGSILVGPDEDASVHLEPGSYFRYVRTKQKPHTVHLLPSVTVEGPKRNVVTQSKPINQTVVVRSENSNKMPRQVTHYRVLIASPGDVEEERGIITEVINAWNAANTKTTKAILEPVKWETHSHPSLGGRAQGIINEQIVSDCDLLIGVFWTRIGTKTEFADSGTVEEIEQLNKAGKPVLLYFSNVPVNPNVLDAKQQKRLHVYKNRLYSQGLIGQYSDKAEFRFKLQGDLAKEMNALLFKDSQAYGGQASNSNQIVLNDHAKRLLWETAQSAHKQILLLRSAGGGTVLSVGPKGFVDQQRKRMRELAEWERAIERLVNFKCLVETSIGSSTSLRAFTITADGFDVADKIDPDKLTVDLEDATKPTSPSVIDAGEQARLQERAEMEADGEHYE